MSEKEDKIKALYRATNNTLVFGTAVQFGVEVLKQLDDVGLIGGKIKGADLDLLGAGRLLIASVRNDLMARAKISGGEK